MNNKKGQLTVFIIIGIVLLFSAALIIYIRQSVTQYQPPTEIPFEQVPTELQPLQRYITDCLDQVAIEAVKSAGVQGGYTDTAALRINERDPTLGNAVQLSPGSDLKIPYWWYLRSGNNCEGNCQFASERPDLEEMEKQIGNYISSRVGLCIGDFQTFTQQGFTVAQGTPGVNVSIGRTVVVVLNYPLTVKREGRVTKLSKFSSQVPVNLKRIYDYATSITNLEIATQFLEIQTSNLMSDFSGIEKRLPPVSESDLGTGNPKNWLKSNVKVDVTSILSSYVPAMQVIGNSNYVEANFDDPYKNGVYGVMRIPIVDESQRSYSELATEFIYFDWWPIYFNIKGRGALGEFITAETTSFPLFPFFSIKRYDNYYDVSYPLVVEVKDNTALGGKGFTFLFALEVNMRNNDPLTTSYQGLPSAQLGGSLLCNQNQRNSGNITVIATDANTNLPLKGALVTYGCGVDACEIGYTENNGILKTKFPICTGGALIASSQGYRATPVKYSSELGKSSVLNVTLYPIKDKKIIVKKKFVYKVCHPAEIQVGPFQSARVELGEGAGYLSNEEQRVGEESEQCYWFFNNNEAPLLNNEQAIISLTKVKDDPNEEDYVMAAVYYGNETYTTAPLVPGKYEVSMTLLYNLPAAGRNTVAVPSRDIIVDSQPWNPFNDKDKTTLPPITFDKAVPEGGLEIDGSNQYWEVSSNNLYNEDAVIIYALNAPQFDVGSDGNLNIRHEDLGQVGKLGDYTDILRQQLEPRYVR